VNGDFFTRFSFELTNRSFFFVNLFSILPFFSIPGFIDTFHDFRENHLNILKKNRIPKYFPFYLNTKLIKMEKLLIRNKLMLQ